MTGDADGSNLRERALHKGKLIDLQGHHAAEQILDALLATDELDPNYEQLVVKAIALGSPILAAVVRRLDSSRPLRLAALGRLVVEYPFRVQAVQTLLRAAADRRNSDHRRMGAMLALNQFLGVPPSEDFLSSLHNPAATAVSALVSTLNECADQPEMLLGYFRALSALPVDVLYAMLHTLGGTPGKEAAAALRLLAIQPDPDLMHAAIEALIARADADAIHALTVLEPNLPPEAAHAAARHLHKLRLLNGYSADRAPSANNAGCRALLGPIDGRGRRLLWLVIPQKDSKDSEAGMVGYLALLLKDAVGVLDTLGAPRVDAAIFPPASTVGAMHTPRTPLPGEAPGLLPHNGAPWCLEVPFAYGLRIVREAVLQNWLSGTPLPLDYQLLFDMVWTHNTGAGDRDEEQFEALFPERAAENENDLLCNPVFDSWYLESGAVYIAAQELLVEDVGLPIEMTDQSWRTLLPMVIKLARSEFSMDVRQSYSARLKGMARWLHIAGQHEDAKLAASAARTMLASPPEANLLALSLVQKGLLVALATLLTGDGLEI